ncbi:MAG TPA: Uma2 family endonuclease [Terriglobia bacterium]|nr:Uma2 family endonuclease [Terriglobia bacterium]
MATKTLITVEEYDALPETENGVEYELSEGELIVLASPTLFHNFMRDDILERFRVFLRQHPHLGRVASETDFSLTASTVRRPDVAFISAAKMASVDPCQKLQFAPDLAIEIALPHDDLPRKIQDYLAAGTRVWALYPDARVARIHKPGKQAVVLDADAGDSLEDAELLPGLKVPLGEIFG